MADQNEFDPSMNRRQFVQGTIILGVTGLLPAAEKTSTAPSFLPGSDWPMYRRDPALTAQSPLKGGFDKVPTVAWTIDLGGPQVISESIMIRDVTGDGRDDILIVSSDSIVCCDNRGELRWKLDNVLNSTILHILDFAGDGGRGILLTTARAGKIDTYLVDGRTGKSFHLWLDENNFGGHLRVGKFLKDVQGLQIISTASGQTPPEPHGGEVRLVSFEQGMDRLNFRVRQRLSGDVYSPLILMADLNNDGDDEVVVISHETVWTFDTKSGQPLLRATYSPSIRTYYATIAAIKLSPTDRYPTLVMINPHLPGLKAVEQDGKTTARQLWKVVIGGQEDQYQKKVTINPAGPSLVYDLNRDGHYLLFASIKNEQSDGAVSLSIFDTRTGRRICDLPESQILAAEDLDGDGRLELLFLRGTELHIGKWVGDQLRSVWQQRNVTPLLKPQPLEGELNLFSANRALSSGNASVWRENPNGGEFLFRFPEGVFACRLNSNGLEKGSPVSVHEALGNLPETQKPAEQVSWNGQSVVTTVDGREAYRYDVPTPVTYLAPPPIVGDLAGKRRILIRDSKGQYRACSVDGQKDQVLIERPNEGYELLIDAAGAGPLICDVDGDGENEIVATIKDTNDRPVCVILDGNGREKRWIELLAGMTSMTRGPTGRLGSGRGRWILLRMTGEDAEHQRLFMVVAYDGRTGQQIWTRNHYGSYGKNPVAFVAHFLSAVWDYDGDGSDDWLACSENFYGIIDVNDNRDLVQPVVLSNAVAGHWTAYTFPTVANRASKKPVVYHHGAFSLGLATDLEGQATWHQGMTRDTGGQIWGQLADLDGDGRLEVLHAQPDGLLRCFTMNPHSRCPSCPTESSLAASEKSDERWRLDLGRPVSRLIAMDVDGDGRMEVIFGCDDGKLYALGERNGQPKVLWSLSLGRRVGEPIVVDLNGDGRAAILVTGEDGKLHCLKGGNVNAK